MRKTDRAWRDYSEAFRKTVLPALMKSAFMIRIVEDVDPGNPDIQAATEMGLMLLLDKPLVVIVPIGETVAASLRRAAAVVLDDVDMNDPADQDRVAAALVSLGAQPDA